MAIPNEIPANARVVVRVSEGVDPTDHRMKYRDYRVTIDADTIITLKPVPERHFTRP